MLFFRIFWLLFRRQWNKIYRYKNPQHETWVDCVECKRYPISHPCSWFGTREIWSFLDWLVVRGFNNEIYRSWYGIVSNHESKTTICMYIMHEIWRYLGRFSVGVAFYSSTLRQYVSRYNVVVLDPSIIGGWG